MSWWVSVNDPETGEPISVESFEEGGTQVMGGSTEADLNITYNYSPHYYRVLTGSNDGLRGLDGWTAARALPVLVAGVAELSEDIDDDYWAATEGNARRALDILRGWCEQAVAQGKSTAYLRVS